MNDSMWSAGEEAAVEKAADEGQLISECLYDFLNFPKNQQKIWQISAQESKWWSNHRIKPYYNGFIQ